MQTVESSLFFFKQIYLAKATPACRKKQ
jgi:hypothetical protein